MTNTNDNFYKAHGLFLKPSGFWHLGNAFKRLTNRALTKNKLTNNWGSFLHGITHDPLCVPRFLRFRQKIYQSQSALTPWWMQQIRQFDRLECHPSKVIAQTVRGLDIIWPCEAERAALWTVYGIYKPGLIPDGFAAFETFTTEAEAQTFHDRLIVAYPHLGNGGYERPAGLKDFIPQISI